MRPMRKTTNWSFMQTVAVAMQDGLSETDAMREISLEIFNCFVGLVNRSGMEFDVKKSAIFFCANNDSVIIFYDGEFFEVMVSDRIVEAAKDGSKICQAASGDLFYFAHVAPDDERLPAYRQGAEKSLKLAEAKGSNVNGAGTRGVLLN